MKSHPLTICSLKSSPSSRLIAAFCATFLSILTTLPGAALAQKSPAEQKDVPAVEVRGQKVPEGPHCIYMNWATLSVKSSGGLLTTKGGLNGSEAIMVVDTGAQHTLLTRQEAEKLGLNLSHSRIVETDAQGDTSATYATFVDDVSLDKFFWHGIKLGVVSHIANSFGALAGADILLNGLNRDVEFSLGTQQIKFFVPSGCENAFLAYWDSNALEIPLVDLSANDPRQVVTVEINGKKLVALIDSGSPISMIDLQAAAALGITPQSAGVTELPGSDKVGKQKGKAWLASFASFSIGDETIKNPKIAIADLWGPTAADATSAMRTGLRLLSLAAPTPAGGVSPATDGLAQIGSFRSEAEASIHPDLLLGIDFLRSHRVLLAISQHRLYYSYLGGRVFGDTDEQKLGENAQAAIGY